jgi:CelD/BcsL family acetyltransferase involved in cellulose biosynthesis
MKITLMPADALSAEHIAVWDRLQQSEPSLSAPFFRPEFCQALAAVCPNIEVAVLKEGHETVGFFAFQRRKGNVGRPIGGPLSDYHGLVLKSEVEIDVEQLFRRCALKAWHFDHLVAEQIAFRRHHWSQASSPYISTSQGFQQYQENRRTAGSQVVARTYQKKRKLEREVGEVRFELENRDSIVLDSLISWKAAQYHESVLYDMFAPQWTRDLFRTLLTSGNPALRGAMSAMYVNDELAAVFFMLRSHRVAHAWCTAYRRDLAKYSPGYQLLLETIRGATTAGIDRIDLGRGTERYKQSFMTDSVPIAEGSVDLRATTRALRRIWHFTHKWVGDSSLRKPLSVPWRHIKRELHRAAFK